MKQDPKAELRVISRTEPPASKLNDSIVVLTAGGAVLCALVFAVALPLGGPLPLYGGALSLGLLLFGVAIRRYFTDRFPDIEAIELREIPDPDHADEPLSDVEALGPRRSFLKRALIASGALFGIGIAAPPIASLGPAPGGTLLRTAWRPGVRLVTNEGLPVQPDDLAMGGIASIWPQDAIGQERSSVLLLRLTTPPVAPTNLDWVVDNVVAYSKVCTHAGCPVALYREQDNALFCPCHQSTFDPSRGAVPTFGPAARALPQLPLGLDDQGYLVALDDFQAQVGPAFD
ncbi:MAG: ubiquinol-cytochrome c reductase iron-sulfur subunit [Euzebyaceae bacterium]|nr:ubiquinol-cytochrome c reductase iron-sulfur subunit [Euzebyaceae bacterium]